MHLVDNHGHPSDRHLRQFGVVCGLALPAIGWMWGAGLSVIALSAAVGTVVAIVSWAWPRGIKPIYIGLMVAAIPLGIVVGEVALLFLYFGVLLPIGIVFRLIRRDALQRTFLPESASYWQSRSQPQRVRNYYRQT